MMKLQLHLLINDRGVALVTVVWSVLLLSLLATGLLSLALTMRETSDFYVLENKNRYVAQSALDMFFSRYFYDAEGRIYREGTITLLEHDVDIRVNYESGKFNINRADISDLSLVFAANGTSESKSLELASAIVDWRDTDDVPMILGAENSQYIDMGLPVGPRNSPFESIGELQFVAGMTLPIYRCIRPLLTVYSLSSSVDTGKAGPRVLEAYKWAYENSWQGETWQNPDELEMIGSGDGNISGLGGQSLEVIVSLNDAESTRYRAVVRYKSTADQSFSVIQPLHRATDYDASSECEG